MGSSSVLLLVALYFLGMIAIGPWAAKKMKMGGSDGYLLAGRSVPLWVVVGGIFATWVSSATLLGYGGMGYSVGLAGYWSGGAFMMMTIWMGMWMIPRLRKENITTIPELFEKYLGLPHRMLTFVLGIARDLGVTAGVSVGMATIFQRLFDIPLDLALLITLGVTLVFTVWGGMWAVMVSDAIQAFIIFIGTTILIPLGIAYAGGWGSLTNKIPATHFNIFHAGIPQSIAWLLTGILITAAYQTLIQRGLSAQSDEIAKKSFLYGGGLSLIWYVAPFIIGIIALVLFPDIAPQEAYLSIIDLTNPFFGTLLTIVIIASCISTLSSTILTISSNLSLDIYKRLINQDADNKRMILVNRISVLVVAAVAVIIGRTLPYILELLWLGGRIMGASLAPVFLAIIFWKAARSSYITTFIAMLLGSIVTIFGQLFGSKMTAADSSGVVHLWTLDPMLMGLPVTLVTLFIGVYLENRKRKLRNLSDISKSV